METLPGRIGRQDVFDVFAATESLLSVSAGNAAAAPTWSVLEPAVVLPSGPLVDSARIGVMGGSHGGFLTAHCIGQKPNFFKAAVLRNPVTNVLSNSTTSDIGDWCVIEGCGSGTYDFNKFISPTMETARQMYDCSPIRYSMLIKRFCSSFCLNDLFILNIVPDMCRTSPLQCCFV